MEVGVARGARVFEIIQTFAPDCRLTVSAYTCLDGGFTKVEQLCMLRLFLDMCALANIRDAVVRTET